MSHFTSLRSRVLTAVLLTASAALGGLAQGCALDTTDDSESAQKNVTIVHDARAGAVLNVGGGTANLRDMGGYMTADGQSRVRFGRLFRSDQMVRVMRDEHGGPNAKGQPFVKGLNLRLIGDFRDDMEIGMHSFRARGQAAPEKITATPEDTELVATEGRAARYTVEDPQSAQVARFAKAMAATDFNELFAIVGNGKARTAMIAGYTAFATRAEMRAQFGALLRDLSKTSGGKPVNLPALYHCVSGKDRTGFATAMILSALGVDRKTIVTDYLLSNKYRAEQIDPWGQITYEAMTSADLAAAGIKPFSGTKADVKSFQEGMKAILGVDEAFIAASFAAIEKQFGPGQAGVDRFLRDKSKGLGLTDSEITSLRANLLEPATKR